MEETKRRIGIVGFGHLGKFLTEAILNHPKLELAFVWNRTKTAFENSNLEPYILEDLQDCARFCKFTQYFTRFRKLLPDFAWFYKFDY